MNAAELIELSNSEYFLSNALTQSLQISVDLLEFRTGDEGLCSANLFACRKTEIPHKAIAFFALLNHELHFYEEWPINETSSNDLELIAKKWLAPEIRKAIDTPSNDVALEVKGITSSIQSRIIEKINSGGMYNPDCWGVFLNRERVLEPPEPWLPSSNCNVIALANEWNEMEFLYETPNFFTLFSWSTGS